MTSVAKVRNYIVQLVIIVTLICCSQCQLFGQGDALRSLDVSGKVSVGFHAVRLSDGVVLASHRPRKLMIPASVQKVVTSAVALEALGGDFSFGTRVCLYEDKLIVIGDGDPLTGDPRVAEAAGVEIYDIFDRWAKLLTQRGVTSLDEIILDDTIIRERRHGDWPKDQFSRWYCAPAAGLNFNDNCVDVNFDLSSGALRVVISPQSRFIAVTDKVRRIPSGTNIWRMTQNADVSELVFAGRASKTGVDPVSTAIDEPPMLFGRVLADRLVRCGIEFNGPLQRMGVRLADGGVPPQVEVIATDGASLADVLTRMNKRSLNFMAECLLLRADVAAGGNGEYQSASRSAASILAKSYGLSASLVKISDGGGMSRNNGLSAEGVCTILRKLSQGANADTFLASLPLSGVDGTLRKRLRDYPNRVAAKTGTLSGVRSLAGYILDQQGRPVIAFGIFCNSIRTSTGTVKAAMDDFVKQLIQ